MILLSVEMTKPLLTLAELFSYGVVFKNQKGFSRLRTQSRIWEWYLCEPGSTLSEENVCRRAGVFFTKDDICLCQTWI